MEDVDTSRYLSVGQSWSRILTIYASHLLVFTKISLATTGSFILIWALVVLPIARGFLTDVNWDVTARTDPGNMIYKLPLFMHVIFKFLVAVFAAISMGSIVKAVSDVYNGKKKHSDDPNVWTLACLKHGLGKAGPLIVLYAMTATTETILWLMSPGTAGSHGSVFMYDSALLIAGPVVLIEGKKGPVESLLRSMKLLVADNLCYSLCTFAAFVKVMDLFLYFWWSTLLVFDISWSNCYTTSGAILQHFPFLVLVPLVTIMQTVVYLNLRVLERRGEEEGSNLEEPDKNTTDSITLSGEETPCSSAVLEASVESEEPLLEVVGSVAGPVGAPPPAEIRVSWLAKLAIFLAALNFVIF